MSSGAEKSGKPCDRFTAPCFIASRVISRITDSVNELALWETCRCLETEGVAMIFTPSKATKSTFRRAKTSRDDLFAFGFALELLNDRADRGGVTAVRRELEILLVSGH